MAKTNGSGAGAIRAAILGSNQVQTKRITFFGQEVEVRQPTMKVILNGANMTDRSLASAQMIINHTYDPESGERVFEDADAEALMELPFGADMRRMQNAINELTALGDDEIKAEEGNFEETELTTS